MDFPLSWLSFLCDSSELAVKTEFAASFVQSGPKSKLLKYKNKNAVRDQGRNPKSLSKDEKTEMFGSQGKH